MYSNLFSPESIEELTAALQTQFLSAIWETFYVTLLSTAFAICRWACCSWRVKGTACCRFPAG